MRAVAELGVTALELRPGETQHEDRGGSFDHSSRWPTNSTRAASAHWRSSNRSATGPWSAMRSKKRRQAPNSSVLTSGGTVFEAEEMEHARLDVGAFLLVRHELRDGACELPARTVQALAFDDAGTHADHLRECPERDAFAVRQTPAAVPPDAFLDAVHVLEELPPEPRLTDPGDAGHGDELRAPLVDRGVEELLDETKLAVPPDEGRLEARRLERAATARSHAERAPECDLLGLTLEVVLSGRGVRDGGLRRRAWSPRRRGRCLGPPPTGSAPRCRRDRRRPFLVLLRRA